MLLNGLAFDGTKLSNPIHALNQISKQNFKQNPRPSRPSRVFKAYF
jgi:hypothetical protein